VNERPPEAALWDALRGGLVTRALALVAELDIARRLANGPRPVAELAAESGADADTLHRLLRALASDGIFAEEEPGVFRNTPASELLTVDGWDDFARLFGGTWLEAVRGLDASGEASFPRVLGEEFWSWLGSHPDERAAFDRAMAQGWQGRLERLETVAWRGDETVVVDVGGGNGSLLRALLERHPEMRGIVFDLPETVRDEASFGDRCTFVEGSFFESVPAADAHVLSTIIHDWDDDAAGRILATVRASAGERLVLLEAVIEPGNEPMGAKWLDLLMLVIAGGRERTEEEWRVLLAASGWEPTRFGKGVIEARPI
jgi:O-methyltransferase domain